MLASTELIQETRNLQRRINDLEKSKDKVASSAFGKMLRETNTIDDCIQIIGEEFQKGVEMGEEFTDPTFTEAFLSAIIENNPINIITIRNGEDFRVLLNLKEVCGDLEDYAKGINYARAMIDEESKSKKKRPYNPRKASEYWRDHIYGNRTSVQYAQTILWRFEGFLKPAPFWIFIDIGSPQPLSSSRGGFPYPAKHPATNFVQKAITRIDGEIRTVLVGQREEIMTRINNDIANIQQVLNEIDMAIAGISPEIYSTPQILREIEINDRIYKLYITRTQRVGLALRPRF